MASISATYAHAMKIQAVADSAVSALAGNKNAIIEVDQPGIGALYAVGEALRQQGVAHVVVSANVFDFTDVTPIPYVEHGEVKLAECRSDFVKAFEANQVVVLDEVQAAQPTIQKFIREKAERGGLLLIYRNYNPACAVGFEVFDDFPAVRFRVENL